MVHQKSKKKHPKWTNCLIIKYILFCKKKIILFYFKYYDVLAVFKLFGGLYFSRKKSVSFDLCENSGLRMSIESYLVASVFAYFFLVSNLRSYNI